MLDGMELVQASDDNDRAWFSVVAGPTAEPGEDPRGIGERALGMWVFLFCSLAFEVLTNALQDLLVFLIENVVERARPCRHARKRVALP